MPIRHHSWQYRYVTFCKGPWSKALHNQFSLTSLCNCTACIPRLVILLPMKHRDAYPTSHLKWENEGQCIDAGDLMPSISLFVLDRTANKRLDSVLVSGSHIPPLCLSLHLSLVKLLFFCTLALFNKQLAQLSPGYGLPGRTIVTLIIWRASIRLSVAFDFNSTVLGRFSLAMELTLAETHGQYHSWRLI